MQQTSDGGFILAGETGVNSNFWLVKTDAAGNKEWERIFGGPRDGDVAYAVQQTSDGGFIIVGRDVGTGRWGDADFWLIKTDVAGNKEWDRIFGGIGRDVAHAVQQTSDGGFIIAGFTWSFGVARSIDFWLVKTDATGNKEWSRTFGGVKSDRAHSVQQTSDGGYIIAGETSSFGAGGVDFWLIKVAPVHE